MDDNRTQEEKKYEEEYIKNLLHCIQYKRFEEAANFIIKGMLGEKIHELRGNKRNSKILYDFVVDGLNEKYESYKRRGFTPKEIAPKVLKEEIDELNSPPSDTNLKKSKQ
jgi:hypothetical protein